jgi:hypothetical protein
MGFYNSYELVGGMMTCTQYDGKGIKAMFQTINQ